MLTNFMQILTTVNVDGPCRGLGFLVKIIKYGLFPILQIGVPIILIVLGTFDLAKAVIASDEKATKEAQGRLVKRCIYAIAVFFIVTLVSLLFTMVGSIAGDSATGLNNWSDCWNNPE